MMQQAPFEIHVHGDIPLADHVSFDDVAEALRPVWLYAGAGGLESIMGSRYDEEPGILFQPDQQGLKICWTTLGDEQFRAVMEECCMALNELASTGAVIEVSIYPNVQDEEDDDEADEPDQADMEGEDFFMLFVGPTPAAILTVQRNMLVQDVVGMMERHFDMSELEGVVHEIDQLFEKRYASLVDSMQFGKPPPKGGAGSTGHGGGRKPRHLH
jgi:hypothetical protein